jgi:hypothetical protein
LFGSHLTEGNATSLSSFGEVKACKPFTAVKGLEVTIISLPSFGKGGICKQFVELKTTITKR